MSDDMLINVTDLPYQLVGSLTLYNSIEGYDGIDEIVIMGMGGSGIVGDFVKSIVDDIEVKVVKSGIVPKMDEHTLAIAVTYSGKTRETLAALKRAAEYDAKVVLVTSSVHNGIAGRVQMIKINGNGYSRASFGYMLAPVLLLLEKSYIINDIRKDIKEAADILCGISKDKSRIEQLKYSLPYSDRMLAVYSNEFTYPAALRWKQMMNENAKMRCYCDVFPELLHNEVEVWHEDVNYTLVILRDEIYESSKEHGYDLYSIISTTKELLRGKGVNIIELFSNGNSKLSRLLSLSYIGDMLSVHMAYKHSVDPRSIPNIEYIKVRG
jgi:glucose/mannose-6-phosphate isomerase